MRYEIRDVRSAEVGFMPAASRHGSPDPYNQRHLPPVKPPLPAFLALQGVPAVAPALAGRHVDQNQRRILLGFEHQGLVDVDAGLVLRPQRFAVGRQLPLGQIDEDPAARRRLVRDRFVGLQVAAIDGGVRMEGYRPGLPLPRRDRQRLVAPVGAGKPLLVVGRLEALPAQAGLNAVPTNAGLSSLIANNRHHWPRVSRTVKAVVRNLLLPDSDAYRVDCLVSVIREVFGKHDVVLCLDVGNKPDIGDLAIATSADEPFKGAVTGHRVYPQA